MTPKQRIELARKKAKEAAKHIFKDKPPEVKKELEKQTTLGRPANLISPECKDD